MRDGSVRGLNLPFREPQNGLNDPLSLVLAPFGRLAFRLTPLLNWPKVLLIQQLLLIHLSDTTVYKQGVKRPGLGILFRRGTNRCYDNNES